MTLRAAKACWSQNSDGIWTWYPQPDGIAHTYEPFDEGLLVQMGAFHEAGHAISSLRMGLGVDGIYLSPSAEGHMFHAVHTGDIRHRDGYMAMLASGERAADRWLSEVGQWTPERAWSVERGARSDRAKAVEFAERTGRTFDFLSHPWDGWTQICSQADGGLDASWDRVSAVANALLTGGSLDAAAVARIADMPNPSARANAQHQAHRDDTQQQAPHAALAPQADTAAPIGNAGVTALDADDILAQDEDEDIYDHDAAHAECIQPHRTAAGYADCDGRPL
ncbi:hypothetical protein [Streptomyces sasae]|uniref:hypothetical protein n=1 Tax=Streptomyces sasae TaxID=1266772 RepID=UPI00292EC43F|nr:hypothetical protein [Streptomyces sasae]